MSEQLEVHSEGRPASVLPLRAGARLVLGRADDADLSVPHEPRLSRRHAEVWLESGLLRVKRLPEASNAVYVGGRALEECALKPGESFTVGSTRFTFRLEAPQDRGAHEPGAAAPLPLKTLSRADLYEFGATAAERVRLQDLLELPELLRSRERRDFHSHLAKLLRSTTGASWACVVTEEGKVLGSDAAHDVPARYHPSRTLVRKALQDAPQPTLYCWSKPGSLMATVQEGLDWAACAAARVPGEPAVVFYASGPSAGADPGLALHRNKARFVGLVADVVGRSFTLDRLLTWETRLEHFFAWPVVSKILRSPDLQELEPRTAASTVLFFDLRGFSRRAEQTNAAILSTIAQLRQVMTVMTGVVLEERGVVLQYQGDGFLACWNLPFEDDEHVTRACRAALRMAEALAREAPGWACGMGLHTGEVVAGAIGSEQVFSYGVLGAVVNAASRIEGITKVLGCPILVTSEIAKQLPSKIGSVLRIGRFQPAGMSAELDLYALAPAGEPRRDQAFAQALSSFEAGQWKDAARLMAGLSAGFPPAAFLRELAERYAATPPSSWRGVVELSSK